MSSAKLAISLPEDLFAEVERVRKRKGLSRSEVIRRGLHAWLRAQSEAEKVRKYVAAYRRYPETDEEIAESARLVQALWGDEG